MELKEGYKQTDIGVIPQEWEVYPLRSISSMNGRIGWQGLNQTEFTMNPDEPFLITGMNFKDGEIRWNEVYHISVERYELAKQIQLKENDVLITKDGTIGKLLHVDKIPYPHKASLNSHLLVFRPLNRKYVSKFLFYQLDSKAFKNHIELEKSGTTFFGITQEAVGKYLAFVPPISEQKAIAQVLSDTDALITALDALIAKKRLIKQGTMQELLTGKRSLEGFTEGWTVKKLEELCIKKGLVRGPFGGALKKDIFVEQGFKVYEQRNAIYGNTILGNYFVDELKYIELKRFQVSVKDFIVSCSGTIGKIYQIPENAPEGIINQALLKIALDSDIIDENFFFHYFIWDKFQEKIIDSTQGGAMKNLVGMSVFKTTEIFMPSTVIEQKAIAQILSDMDTEIATLEAKRDKYKQVKQGMMQELLTGKTRLTT